jgi:hypothetical protein
LIFIFLVENADYQTIHNFMKREIGSTTSMLNVCSPKKASKRFDIPFAVARKGKQDFQVFNNFGENPSVEILRYITAMQAL